MKKILTLVLFVLVLTGCADNWSSKEVLSKSAKIESVSYQELSPGYGYRLSCNAKGCGYKYGFNPSRRVTKFRDEMVYRVTFLLSYEDGDTREVEEIVSEEEYNSTVVGHIETKEKEEQ